MVAVSVVIPTFNRSGLLVEAVDSALSQTLDDVEVIVVDDGSAEPVRLAAHPRVRVVRLDTNLGVAAARNVGLAEAKGRWVTYLDDDDLYLPNHLDAALSALAAANLPAPVATLSGVQVLDAEGRPVETRMPPTMPRGKAFSLEERPPGTSFRLKMTLLVEREVLLGVGGYDEHLRCREHTELFLRLNPVCSLIGVQEATYIQRRHGGAHLSKDLDSRAASTRRIERKHRDLFAAHRERHADLVFQQAFNLWVAGRRGPGLSTWLKAMRLHPVRAGRRSAIAIRDRLSAARG